MIIDQSHAKLHSPRNDGPNRETYKGTNSAQCSIADSFGVCAYYATQLALLLYSGVRLRLTLFGNELLVVRSLRPVYAAGSTHLLLRLSGGMLNGKYRLIVHFVTPIVRFRERIRNVLVIRIGERRRMMQPIHDAMSNVTSKHST